MNNYFRMFLLLVIGLFLFSTGVSQDDRPKPVLIDEMGTWGDNCEELFMRLDHYFAELANNPVDQGYAIVYQTPRSRTAGRNREHQIKNHTKMRKFDSSRITIIAGGVRANAMVQLWRVPPGAENPATLVSDSEYAKPEPPAQPADEPYIYATQFLDGIPGCSGPVFDLEAYAAVLNENAGNSGNIVIGAGSRSAFQSEERGLRRELEGYGVRRSRIRTFFKKVKPNAAMEFIELWVLPAKRAMLPPRDPNRYTVIGDRDIEPPLSTEAERADTESVEPPAPPRPPPPTPPRSPKMISGGVLNGKATSLPKPAYPPAGHAVSASGAVNVQVTVDEQGNVISAAAVSGHPLLRASAVQAARAAKFSPTMLSGVPVKVTGIIVYNFVN